MPTGKWPSNYGRTCGIRENKSPMSILLIAALAQRLDGVVVTSDDEFDALPIRRENWRAAQ